VRPFGGEKVHWTFSSFRLTSHFTGEGEMDVYWYGSLAIYHITRAPAYS
jgi:hypothetical protein